MTVLYNAGIFTSSFDKLGRVYARLTPEEQKLRDSCTHFLESYHYIGKESSVRRIRKEGVKVFLDSGAFSAYSLGEVIDIGRYCDYIHSNQDIIDFPSVLDAIGDYKGTYKNQMEMERRGVKPLPCFHYGEPTEVLDYYVANYPYITIGGMVPISTPQLLIWLDRIWQHHLTDENGKPKVKVHGFGLTSLPLMLRYPWYSVDSSTWVQWAANGMVLMPDRGKQLNISSQSASRKQQGQHLDTLRPLERETLERELIAYGADPQRLRDLYYARWAFNCWAFPHYLTVNSHRKLDVFKATDPGLF